MSARCERDECALSLLGQVALCYWIMSGVDVCYQAFDR